MAVLGSLYIFIRFPSKLGLFVSLRSLVAITDHQTQPRQLVCFIIPAYYKGASIFYPYLNSNSGQTLVVKKHILH